MKIFKHWHTVLCSDIKNCRNLRTFWKIWVKKCFFGTITVFLGQEVHYHMIYTAYYTELNCQICNYAQKRRIFHKQIRAWRFFFGIMCFIYCAKTLKSPTLDISNTNFKSFLPFALVKIRVQTSGSAAVAPEITWSASKPVSILHHKQAISNKLWCFVQFIAAWPILGRKTWKSSFFFCKYATYKAIV